MRNKAIILNTLLLISVIGIWTSSSQTAIMTPDASLNVNITAGNTYWYTVTKATSFNDLLSELNNPDFTIDVLGDFVGSQIYAKVISTQTEIVTNNFTQSSSEIPTIDIATGLITVNPIDIVLGNALGSITKRIPSGIGLPIPIIFGSSSQFNVSAPNDLLFPLPLALHDDYAIHEDMFSRLQSNLPTGQLIVDNNLNSFDVSIENLTNNSIRLDSSFSYLKSDGVLQNFEFSLTNVTTATVISEFGITLTDEQSIGLSLEVGQEFELNLNDFNLEYVSTGFDVDPLGGLNELALILKSFINTPIVTLKITEISGLRYKASVNLLNGVVGDVTEVWFNGFGTFSLGTSLNLLNMNSTNPRLFSLPGIVVSPDWEIYDSWDKTLQFVVEDGVEILQLLLSVLDSQFSNIQLRSSLSADPIFVTSYDHGFDANGIYSTDFSAAWDIGATINETLFASDNVTAVGWEYADVSYRGDFAMQTSYTNTGYLNNIAISSNLLSLYIDYQNSTGYSQSTNIEFSSVVIDISVTEILQTEVITSSTTVDVNKDTSSTIQSTSPTSKANDSPILILPFLISLLGLVVIIRFRHQRTS